MERHLAKANRDFLAGNSDVKVARLSVRVSFRSHVIFRALG